MTTHTPDRPTWECAGCGKDWPCDPAREGMAAGGINTSLRIAAWGFFEQAAEDMPTTPAAELHERFIGWMRRPR